MSEESKWKTMRDWIAALGTPVALVGVAVTLWLGHNNTLEQRKISERENRVVLSQVAYNAFIRQMIGNNTRVPIALYGTGEVLKKFANLERIVQEIIKDNPAGKQIKLSDPKVLNPFLELITAIRVDTLGDNYSLDVDQLKEILDIRAAEETLGE